MFGNIIDDVIFVLLLCVGLRRIVIGVDILQRSLYDSLWRDAFDQRMLQGKQRLVFVDLNDIEVARVVASRV